MVEITYQMVLSTLQTVGLLVGIVYYIFIMRNSQKTQDLSLKAQEQALETRKAQLYMQIYSRLDDNEFWENYGRLVYEYEYKGMDDFLEKYGPGTKTGGYASYMSMNAFFRGIGVLIDKELIDIDVVDQLLGVTSMRVWEKIKPIAMDHRERFDYSRESKWVEYLANKIMEREQNL